MGPAFYVMAILGCGEADVACEPVATVATQYASQEECNAATADAIMRHSDALYPVVVAQCRAANEKIAQKVFADEVERPQAKPRIRAASYQPKRARS